MDDIERRHINMSSRIRERLKHEVPSLRDQEVRIRMEEDETRVAVSITIGSIITGLKQAAGVVILTKVTDIPKEYTLDDVYPYASSKSEEILSSMGI